jgi:gamma-aminobutyric acid type B receptor
MYVGMSLYNVVLLSITTAVVGYFLRDQHERSYILTSIFILLCVTITLCLVFVPKVLEVAKDPGSRAKPQRAVISNTKIKSAEGQEHDIQRRISRMKNLTNQNEMLQSSATKVSIGIDSSAINNIYKDYMYSLEENKDTRFVFFFILVS